MKAEDIEVTPEMIEAGSEPLSYFYADAMGEEYEEEERRTLTEIYRAMRLVALANGGR